MKKNINQKARFNGQPKQTFNLGTRHFASGVWIVISPDELKALIDAGVKDKFSFDPVIAETVASESKQKKSTKKSSKGGK